VHNPLFRLHFDERRLKFQLAFASEFRKLRCATNQTAPRRTTAPVVIRCEIPYPRVRERLSGTSANDGASGHPITRSVISDAPTCKRHLNERQDASDNQFSSQK
jgi:hypothetical protein